MAKGQSCAFGNRQQKRFLSLKSDFSSLQSCSSWKSEGVLQSNIGFVVDNTGFVGCNSELAGCLVCFALSLSTADVGFLMKLQGLPFVMKQIIDDCDTVLKSLNALVVCSSNIYVARVNNLPR